MTPGGHTPLGVCVLKAWVDRRAHACRVYLGTTMIYIHGFESRGTWCFYLYRSAVIDQGDFDSLDILRADIGIDCEIGSV